MHNVSNKELLLMALIALPFTALGALATSELPAYFRASQELGMHAFEVQQWYSVSRLMSLYAALALFATTILGVSLTTWIKRNWLRE